MFGFGKRKNNEPEKQTRRSTEYKDRKSQNLAQLGILAGVGNDGDIDNLMGNMDVGDDDLEEELAMLLDGDAPPAPPRRPKASPSKKPASAGGRSKGVANPINFDLNEDDADEDVDVDLDDPELEAELGDILGIPSASGSRTKEIPMSDDDDSEETPPPAPTMSREQLISLLQERLQLYENAKQASDAVGDSAKSRRFTRGIKTLKELLSKAKAGRVVDEADIPPVVAIGAIKKDREPPPETSHSIEPSVPVNDTREEVSEPQHVEPPPIQGNVFDDNVSFQLPPPLVPSPVQVTPSRPPPPVPPKIEKPSSGQESGPTSVELASSTIDPAVEVRIKEYKQLAVALKRQGNIQEAMKYLKLSKDLDSAAKSGQSINLNDFPSAEAIFSNANEPTTSGDGGSSAPAENQIPSQPTPSSAEPVQDPTPAATDAPPAGPEGDIFGAPPPPKTVMEALEQRLNKYKSEVEKASAASNSSKARRMGRIVKQYEEAITLYKKGKPVPFDDLPTPPGFAPIPVGGAATVEPPAVKPPPQPTQPSASTLPPGSAAVQPGTPEKKPKTDSASPGSAIGTSPGTSGLISRGGKPPTKLTLQEKQLQIILKRQQQFKEAALNAKKRGDLNQAREFLRTAKGFDNLIQVAQSGLPVDMATLPAPPEAVAELDQMEHDNFEVVSASDCIMPTGDAAEVFAKLEADLKQQMMMCMRTRDHFKKMGDVGSANKFESMAIESKRDLDALRLAMKKNGCTPKYHYENRIFSITECNTDVGEDEIEISIIQGINYKVSNPADVDTFVKVELPYPSAEEVQSAKTGVVKDTNNPAYNATYKMNINRTARNFQRFVHRHGFKCEVWSRGGLCSGGFFFCKCNSGFLRGNTLIGTASVKIMPLETKCTLHDAFDVLDGRKVVGKLEVKVRIREPVLTKQITQKKEKWLSIDRA